MNIKIIDCVALKSFGFEGQMITPDTLLRLPENEAKPLLRRELIRLAAEDDLLDADEEAELAAMIAAEEAAAAEAAAAEAAAAEAAAEAAAAEAAAAEAAAAEAAAAEAAAEAAAAEAAAADKPKTGKAK